MTTASDSLLDSLVTASVAAGREILAVYAAPIAVEEKPDHSPVTEADRRAEQVILAALAVAAPGVPVVAEESVAAGIVPEIGETFFLVDPLDGTKEFIERNGEFTVNIALIEAGVPVMGVVYVPVTGEVFIGGPDGAFAAQIGADGQPGPYRRLWARTPPATGLTVVGSRSHGSPETEAFIAGLDVAASRVAGSSLKFCLVAAGEADVYPRFTPTMEWDTAAGDAVLRAAGGSMTEADGTPFLYGNRRPRSARRFANPSFIARGRPAVADGASP